MRRVFTFVLALAAFAGCAAGGGAEEEATSEDELRTPSFVDASPERPLAGAERATLVAALGKLDRVARRAVSPLRRALARETLARIEEGRVLLGSVAGARGIDRWHMCKDYSLPACAPPAQAPAEDDRSWYGDDQLTETLERELDGYMWANRLYFTIKPDTDPDVLAATLVHEVNHVLNRSECSYYSDIEAHVVAPEKAFVEEYRAFLSECYFVRDTTATIDACHEEAFASAETYELNPDLSRVLPPGAGPRAVAEAIVAGGDPAPFGRLVPEAERWPESFGACPAP